MGDTKLDEIIRRIIARWDIPDEHKTFDKMDDRVRMMLVTVILMGDKDISDDEKAVLKEWLKNKALMA